MCNIITKKKLITLIKGWALTNKSHYFPRGWKKNIEWISTMILLVFTLLQISLRIQGTVAACPETLSGLTKWSEMTTVRNTILKTRCLPKCYIINAMNYDNVFIGQLSRWNRDLFLSQIPFTHFEQDEKTTIVVDLEG